MLQVKHVKEFCTDGVTAKPQFFDESVKHFINEAVKVFVALLEKIGPH